MQAEIFFLKNTFIVQARQIQKMSKGKLIKATAKELQDQISKAKNSKTKINFKDLETLHKIFGEFELLQ